jgi:hypothetical protein
MMTKHRAMLGQEPQRENGVRPDLGCMPAINSPRSKGAMLSTMRPRWSTIAVSPLLVARNKGLAFSAARICAICKCCGSASELPNHASLLTVSNIDASTVVRATKSG